MTRKEAKEILTHNWTRVDNPNYSESELDEAFFMAIEALSDHSGEVTEMVKKDLTSDGTLKVNVSDTSNVQNLHNGDLISREDAVKTVIRKCSPICAWQVGTQQYPNCVVAEINALPSAEAVQVAYVCDRRACNGDCTSEECTHTKDIEHAKNFIRIGDAYMEQTDVESVVRCKDCKWYECGGLPCPLDLCESLGDNGFCPSGERREE